MVEVVRVKAAAAAARNVRRSWPAPGLSTPLRATSSWPSSATRSPARPGCCRPPDPRLAPAGRTPRGVLVFHAMDRRGPLAAGPGRHLGQVEGGARRRAQHPRWLGPCSARRPDSRVLSDAGLRAGRTSPVRDRAPVDPARAGRVHPVDVVSFRSRSLGDQADAFDADLAARLGPHSDASTFTESVSFFYQLAEKPTDAVRLQIDREGPDQSSASAASRVVRGPMLRPLQRSVRWTCQPGLSVQEAALMCAVAHD